MRGMMDADLRSATASLLRPGSIAIVGASEDPSLPGGRLLHSLVGGRYPGPIYPVLEPRPGSTRRPAQVLARKALHDITEIPKGTDMAVIVLPPARAAATAQELVQRGVRAIVVPVPGFGEAHQEGRDLQARMVDSVRCGGARLLGPNTMGIYSVSSKVDLVTGVDPAPEGVANAYQGFIG